MYVIYIIFTNYPFNYNAQVWKICGSRGDRYKEVSIPGCSKFAHFLSVLTVLETVERPLFTESLGIAFERILL